MYAEPSPQVGIWGHLMPTNGVSYKCVNVCFRKDGSRLETFTEDVAADLTRLRSAGLADGPIRRTVFDLNSGELGANSGLESAGFARSEPIHKDRKRKRKHGKKNRKPSKRQNADGSEGNGDDKGGDGDDSGGNDDNSGKLEGDDVELETRYDV